MMIVSKMPELGVKRNHTTFEKIIVNDEDRYIKRSDLDFSQLPEDIRKKLLQETQ